MYKQLGRLQKEARHPEDALTPCVGIYDRLDVRPPRRLGAILAISATVAAFVFHDCREHGDSQQQQSADQANVDNLIYN
jgi:hypothetical protein